MWVARSIALVLLVASCDLPTQPPIASPSPSTAAARVLQRGADQYIPIAFEADWIYLIRPGANVSDAPENLYRLDPAGGTQQLIKVNFRHSFPWSWTLIADGAAWGYEIRGE